MTNQHIIIEMIIILKLICKRTFWVCSFFLKLFGLNRVTCKDTEVLKDFFMYVMMQWFFLSIIKEKGHNRYMPENIIFPFRNLTHG